MAELRDANKCELALLAGEYLTRRDVYYRLADQAERAKEELDNVERRLRDKIRVMEGCDEEEWDHFTRWAFDVPRLQRVVSGKENIAVFGDLIR